MIGQYADEVRALALALVRHLLTACTMRKGPIFEQRASGPGLILRRSKDMALLQC